MHYTLRVALQRGTPTVELTVPHVMCEYETTEDLANDLWGIGSNAAAIMREHPEATADDLLATLIAEHGTVEREPDALPLWERDGPDLWRYAGQHPFDEALRSLEQVRNHVEAVYAHLHASEIGGGLETGAASLGEALSDLSQAIRFLTGQEVPA